MSQVSRPVQLALLAVLVLGALWFFALRPHTQSTTSTPAPAPAPAASAPATGAKPYNTKTPVIGGLLGAVNKANGAVATSQANANRLEHDSAAASSPSGTPVTTASATASAGAAASRPGTAATPATTTHAGATAGAGSAAATRGATAAGARTSTPSHAAGAATAAVSPAVTIKNELAAGKTVALLFWNPLGADDRAVHSALEAFAKGQRSLVLDFATASQVASYGTIVTAAEVLETPTLLVMRGKTIQTITDLQDPTDLRQYMVDLQAGGPGEVLTPKLASYAPGTTRVAYLARANRLCARANNQTVALAPTDTATQAAGQLVAADQGYLAQLAAIPPPPGDRRFIHDLLTISARGNREFAASLTTSNPYVANNDLLSGETNADRAVEMADEYGLTDCVAPDLR